jgi:hydrogenase-4 component E
MSPVSAQLCTLGASVVLLAALIPLWRRHVPAYVSAFRWQSIALAAVTALVGFAADVHELYVISALILLVRAFAIPFLLQKMQVRIGQLAELDPYLNVPASLLVAALLVGIAYWVTRPAVLVAALPTRAAMPLAMAEILVSIFVIASRKKALSQIIGFLMLENGIALLSVVASYGVPLVIELGVFLDAVLGFLVMQVFVFDIHETFESVDVDQLNKLKH